MSNISLKQFLKSLPKDEQIYFKANPGNAGDAIIAASTYQLFKECELNIISINSKDFDASNKIVIWGGGGNLVGLYPDLRDFLDKNHKRSKQFIVLPHTVSENEKLLETLGENVTIFAREQVSYQHLLKHAKNATVYLDHDVAICLNVPYFIDSSKINIFNALLLKIIYKLFNSSLARKVPSISIMIRNSIFEFNSLFLRSKETGNFFRDDVESLKLGTPKTNVDLSEMYEYGTHNEEIVHYTTQRLMRYINHFSTVRTDRLHICIAAALLNKQVEFYPNSYFKCKAVYEYSLKEKFPNVKWMGNNY